MFSFCLLASLSSESVVFATGARPEAARLQEEGTPTKIESMRWQSYRWVLVSAVSVGVPRAQTPLTHRDEADPGYSVGVGTFSAGRVKLHTVRGVKIGDRFSTGVGTGFYFSHRESLLIVLFYVGFEGTRPYRREYGALFFDIGAGIGMTGDVGGHAGWMCRLPSACGSDASRRSRATVCHSPPIRASLLSRSGTDRGQRGVLTEPFSDRSAGIGCGAGRCIGSGEGASRCRYDRSPVRSPRETSRKDDRLTAVLYGRLFSSARQWDAGGCGISNVAGSQARPFVPATAAYSHAVRYWVRPLAGSPFCRPPEVTRREFVRGTLPLL